MTTQSSAGGAADAPAFPVVAGHQVYATGLSMRDYFAIHAPEHEIERYREFTAGRELFNEHFKYTPEQARYRFADAMLAARTQPDDAKEDRT